MPGSIVISGSIPGIPSGQLTVGPFTIVGNANSNFAETSVTLASGANTITVPTWAVGCIIIPNNNNAIALTLKGVTGDTGVPISETAPTLLNFQATPPTSFVITAASLTVTITSITFF